MTEDPRIAAAARVLLDHFYGIPQHFATAIAKQVLAAADRVACPELAEGAWRPIGEAKRDGTRYLLRADQEGYRILMGESRPFTFMGWWSEAHNGWEFHHDDDPRKCSVIRAEEVTHYQPLPAPPSPEPAKRPRAPFRQTVINGVLVVEPNYTETSADYRSPPEPEDKADD